MKIKKISNSITSYFRYNWDWIRVLKSPFVGLRLRCYLGDIQYGVPYMLPRSAWFSIRYISLGWKTKYGDFRHTWDPLLSIVFCKKQFVMFVKPNIKEGSFTEYWESWLNYRYKTDRILSVDERVKQLIKNHSATWVRYKNDVKITNNYYYSILKPKYRKYIPIEDIP
jgi:hypothetical protein